jgi:hypothetical protein
MVAVFAAVGIPYVIAIKVAAKDGLIEFDVAGAWVRCPEAGVAASEGYSVDKLERGRSVAGPIRFR